MTYLSDDTFELFLSRISNQGAMDSIRGEVSNGIDLQYVNFIDPYGMVGILEAGRFLKSNHIERILLLPKSEEVLKYLERMDFFKYAYKYFRLVPDKPKISGEYLRSSYSDVLLEITPIEKSDDIHNFV